MNPFSAGDRVLEEAARDGEKHEGFWATVKKQFRKNKLALFAFRFIMFLGVLALLADFIAN